MSRITTTQHDVCLENDCFIDRDVLEKMALEQCRPEIYYDLADDIDSVSDDDLINVILTQGSVT